MGHLKDESALELFILGNKRSDVSINTNLKDNWSILNNLDNNIIGIIVVFDSGSRDDNGDGGEGRSSFFGSRARARGGPSESGLGEVSNGVNSETIARMVLTTMAMASVMMTVTVAMTLTCGARIKRTRTVVATVIRTLFGSGKAGGNKERKESKSNLHFGG